MLFPRPSVDGKERIHNDQAEMLFERWLWREEHQQHQGISSGHNKKKNGSCCYNAFSTNHHQHHIDYDDDYTGGRGRGGKEVLKTTTHGSFGRAAPLALSEDESSSW
jgi:hypothetical protein